LLSVIAANLILFAGLFRDVLDMKRRPADLNFLFLESTIVRHEHLLLFGDDGTGYASHLPDLCSVWKQQERAWEYVKAAIATG